MVLQPWEVVTASLAFTCWVMTVVKVRDLIRRPADRALRYLCVVLMSITLALTLQPVAWKLDQWTAVLDLGRVLANCLTLAAVAAGRAMLVTVASPDESARRARRPLYWALVWVAAIVGLLVVMPPAYDLADPYVRSREYYYATATPAAAPYGLVYLICLGWACVYLALSTMGYARVAGRPLVRVGMRLISAGVLFAGGYVVVKVAAMVAASVHAPTYLFDRLIIVCYSCAIVAVLIGSTIASWGPRVGLDRLLDAFLAWNDCRRLRPLWQAVYEAVPQIALLPHPGSPALRRIRLTVEILDGYVLLGGWISPDDEHVARAVVRGRARSVVDSAAEVEAMLLTFAIDRRRAGQPPHGQTPAWPSPLPAAVSGDKASTGAMQVQHLARVAKAMSRAGRHARPLPAAEARRPHR